VKSTIERKRERERERERKEKSDGGKRMGEGVK
jgi:hypothetical protein